MAEPSRSAAARAIATRLVAAGWRYRRGSTAPWVPPGEFDGEHAGYSLLGAAERQAEIERRTLLGERQAR